MKPIKPKDKDQIVRALRSGVVPRSGLQHIQVGRYHEIKSFLSDIENVADGGTSFRIVIGEYGSGKTFFLTLARTMAMERGLVTMHADLSASKRLYGREGQVRTLLSELVTSLSTRTRSDGGALPTILERLVSVGDERARSQGISETEALAELLSPLKEYPGGFAFARVVETYCQAYENGNEYKMGNAMRWLRCEYATKTDALRDLGIREYITDQSFYATLVLYSVLVRLAGYKGLYVCLDEMVNLYKITNTVSRKANYEEVLTMLNATLQGNVQGLGIVLGGTPAFLTDTSRGLYSYEALRSRLAENSFSKTHGLNDYTSTVLRLPNLTAEEMYLLLQNLRNVFALGDTSRYLVPDAALTAYLEHCRERVGESYFRTPRNTIKGFIDMLSVLEQYPERDWRDLVGGIDIDEDREPSSLAVPSAEQPGDTDAFANLKL